jgi:hypothetical protein
MVALTKSKALITVWLGSLLVGHRRRAEQERDFYRNLAAYCRDNNVSPLCEDDWKTAAHIRNRDAPAKVNSKGDVLWTKANLPR